mmetsp:Transcript_5822/g.7423  ORF Transcript_5822/g.7423 Transcript_5822/m.7423 type:complete len:220 (-) Transcript_5822:2518-3177(-)
MVSKITVLVLLSCMIMEIATINGFVIRYVHKSLKTGRSNSKLSPSISFSPHNQDVFKLPWRRFSHGMHTVSDAVSVTSLSSWQLTTLIVCIAAILGLSSQKLINSMLEGEQGLTAFLKDGKGFNKSSFKPLSQQSTVERPLVDSDPLPWLKLPRLSFVEVAGQEITNNNEELDLIHQLDSMREKMKRETESGENEKASVTMMELNALMKKNGFEYIKDT